MDGQVDLGLGYEYRSLRGQSKADSLALREENHDQ